MVTEARQCRATHKQTKERCKRPAVDGANVCAVHGGLSRREKAKILARTGNEIMQFIQPIPESHPLANPINGFYDTWRFNEGRIAYLKDKIAKFDNENDLTWGKTKEERISAGEFPGTNMTYEAKKNIWVALLDEAIEQRIKLLALAAKLGIEKAKLDSAKGLRDQTVAVIIGALRNLGFDPNDDSVKTAIRQAIEDAQTASLRGTPAAGVIPATRRKAGEAK